MRKMSMMLKVICALCVVGLLAAAPIAAQAPKASDKPAPTAVSADAKKDIQRHRAIAAAHDAAARCLESGKAEDACHKDLQAACKGLAIGKYCGMRHEH
jgi:hypothetical protein